MKKIYKYIYFIVYDHPTGFGTINLPTTYPSINIDVIQEFVKYIENTNKFDNVRITNIIPLPLTHPESLEVTE